MQSETPASIPLRLQRLRDLVVQRADSDFGRSRVADLLAQDPQAPGTRCPRHAGILEESGEGVVIVAHTVEQLALDMAEMAVEEIPHSPVEAIDLDSGERQPAYCEATVTFGSPRRPSCSSPAARPAIRKRIVLSILGFTALAAISRQDFTPLVDLIAFTLALSLYAIAPAILLALALSPLAAGYALWLYVRHRRGYPPPVWLDATYDSAVRRAPLLARLTGRAGAD